VKLSVLCGVAMLTGCAGLRTVAPAVTPTMVSSSHGLTAETLNAGRRVFATQCTSCHSADPVPSRSVPEWREVVAKMKERSKLSNQQESALLAYIAAVHGSAEVRN
jgi:mono/diheme cytochrome c family protein